MPKDIQLFENEKEIEYTKDSVILSNQKKELSVLFVIRQSIQEDIKNALIKTIRTLSGKDKINLAVILDQDTSMHLIHYVSPDFSENHNFFINFLEQDLSSSISYELTKKKRTTILSSERFMFSKLEAYSNKGVILLAEEIEIKDETCSNIFNDKTNPIYIILTKEPKEKIQDELINISMSSGGIYTISEANNIEKQLSKYLEDIALHINNLNSKLYRIVFKTNQTKEKNFFEIRYNDEQKEYIFTKPPNYMFSKRERVLLAVSIFLFFMVLVIFFTGNRRNLKGKGLNKGFAGSLLFPDREKPIEINVKTEGFNKTYFFEKHIIRIGRSSNNDIIIPDRTVSGTHAVINKEGDSYMIQDAGSTNGVLLNLKKVNKHILKSKDRIKLGSAVLVVRI